MMRTRPLFRTITAIFILFCVLMADLPSATIVTFGDSTTAERGALKIYSALLEEELQIDGKPVRVINAGVPGDTTERARARLVQDVLRHRPDIVIIQFGINDSAMDVWKTPPAAECRVPLNAYTANLRDLVRQCQEAGARVVLMTPNPIRWTPGLIKQYGKPPYQPEDPDGFNVFLRSYAQAVRSVADERNAGLVDVFAVIDKKGNADDLLLDGMHPNEHGHRLVADLLKGHLSKNPFVSPPASTRP